MFTLGTAAKHVGKSKPTISKAIRDGKLSAKKVNGVFEIDPSELTRVFSSKPAQPQSAPLSDNTETVSLALAKQHNTHLEAAVDDLKTRLESMQEERDQARQDSRDDRNRVVALLEDQRPKSLWSRLFK